MTEGTGMRVYGLYGSVLGPARSALAAGAGLDEVLAQLYRKPTGADDGLALALLQTADPGPYAAALAAALDVDPAAAAAAADRLRVAREDFLLTGAEASALLLARAGAEIVFAYPGTSELAVCDAVARLPATRLVNARGDKEAAFMAAGASASAAGRGAAILHGARGLTNAAGGIADARRNECGSLAVVGLPSTASAPYLPPHGEPDLLAGIGTFARSWYELDRDPASFLAVFAAAVADLRRPYGPVLVGLPQDVAQEAWLPWPVLCSRERPAPRPAPSHDRLVAAVAGAARVAVLVDDYYLRYPSASATLGEFAARTGAVVLQVRYQRGPMLFDRLDPETVPGFAGWLDPADGEQQKLLADADLLVTLEDRNMYQRVVGELPACRKVALSSDPDKVRKNDYLAGDDLLVAGDVAELLRAVTRELPERRAAWLDPARVPGMPPVEVPSPAARDRRDRVAGAVAGALAAVDAPVLVDDGQMFGGLLAEAHDRFPAGLRIFGDHGGFVGGGIAYATGLALAEPGSTVLCTLGDQAFGNGLQGLVAAVEQRAPVTFLVCNNGGSVSLLKQARAAGERLLDDGAEPFLANSPVSASAVAAAMGLGVVRVDCVDGPGAELQEVVTRALSAGTPQLVELLLPADADAWAGIWITGGFDERGREEGR
jgi:acetolactate synthase I/II/III large subunit